LEKTAKAVAAFLLVQIHTGSLTVSTMIVEAPTVAAQDWCAQQDQLM